MQRLLTSILLFAPCLHSEEKSGIDVSINQFSHLATADSLSFYGQSLGIGVRVPDPDRTNNVFRATIEKGIHTSGYSLNSISNIHNYFSLSFDYVWNHSKPLFLGAGVRVVKFIADAPPPSPYGTMSTIKYGTNNSALPQFIVGYRFTHHISIELDTSLIQNNFQLRCSY